ncbi:MAG TPA: GNAT family N-acetyltransferase [Actinomycetota bacterium]|nr:GNAT family N-acetyltransferase [Actinomycetota bacterium]
MHIRAARIQDAKPAAALLLELPGGLDVLFPDPNAAERVARALFSAPKTVLSHRFSLVAEDRGEVVGLMVRLPGHTWRRLRILTGAAMVRAAGLGQVPRVIRQGRIQDRLIPSVPRDCLYVPALAVVPSRRDQGIGASLLLRALGEAAEGGHSAVVLDVDATNERATRLYERHGFLRVSAREATAARGMPAMASVRMERPLRAGP